MEEIIRLNVSTDIEKDNWKDNVLEIIKDDEGYTYFSIDGKKFCGLDYDSNLRIALKRMLEIWGSEDEDANILEGEA